MPVGFQNKICGLVCDGETGGISATVRSDASTVSDVERWLADFQSASKMTFRVERNRLGENATENLYNVSTWVHLKKSCLHLFQVFTG